MLPRKKRPRDDYLTVLSRSEVAGLPLDDDDLVVLMAAFLGAGHHSTTSAMTSLLFEVYARPDVHAAVLADPALVNVAVEEALRLRPPFFGFFRRTTEPVDVAGVHIEEGVDVYLGWAAANRDPQVFDRPAEFCLDRQHNRHVSFGHGIHTCPGAALARMEMRVVLQEMLRRLPDLTVEIDELTYEFGGGDYAFAAHLPVSFGL